MYTTHPPAHHNHVLQPAPVESAPPVPPGWDPWQVHLSDPPYFQHNF